MIKEYQNLNHYIILNQLLPALQLGQGQIVPQILTFLLLEKPFPTKRRKYFKTNALYFQKPKQEKVQYFQLNTKYHIPYKRLNLSIQKLNILNLF